MRYFFLLIILLFCTKAYCCQPVGVPDEIVGPADIQTQVLCKLWNIQEGKILAHLRYWPNPLQKFVFQYHIVCVMYQEIYIYYHKERAC
jgi:hypothetical protein